MTGTPFIQKCEPGEHLLPNAFAVPECIEVMGSERAIKGKQLANLPGERGKSGNEQADLWASVKPADPGSRREYQGNTEKETASYARHNGPPTLG